MSDVFVPVKMWRVKLWGFSVLAQTLSTAFGDCSPNTVELQGVYHLEGGAGAACCGLGELKDPHLALLPIG